MIRNTDLGKRTNFGVILQYDAVLKAFCEDSKQVQPDVFFGIFDTFLMSFGDAKMENDKLKKQKEEEEKRKKIEEQVSDTEYSITKVCFLAICLLI